MIYTGTYQSPLGGILLAADEIGLTGLWFEGQKYFAHTLPGEQIPQGNSRFLTEAKKWLDLYFSGKEPNFTTAASSSTAPRSGRQCGSFCWRFLMGRRLPMERLQDGWRPCRTLLHMSAQAVGGAVGHNEISIIIPCHRVVGTNGSLTGYAGGIDRKIALLEAGTYRYEGIHLLRKKEPRFKKFLQFADFCDSLIPNGQERSTQ